MTPKARSMRKKLINCTSKIKDFCSVKNSDKRMMKREAKDWEKIFANTHPAKDLYLITYKELSKGH